MARMFLVVSLALAAAGCGGSSAAPAKYATYSGHGYQVEAEIKDGLAHGVEAGTTTDETGNTVERIQLRTGEVTLLIVGGQLSVNGERRATVKSGDRIRVLLNGKLYVNDAEWRPK